MIQAPMDVLCSFPVRKSKKQKQAFRDAVQSYAASLGYDSRVEKGSFGARNILIGDHAEAEYLVTAHYDTCARLPIPNLITPCNFWAFLGYQLLVVCVMLVIPLIPAAAVGFIAGDFMTGYDVWYGLFWVMLLLMLFGPANRHNANDNTSGVVTVLEIARSLPKELRGKVCFVLFDLEEAGLIGSASYQSKHKKETENQIVLNLDCVGDGDELMMFPTGKLKKDLRKLDALRSMCGRWGKKSLALRDKGFCVYPSDQANLPYGVGIAAFRRSNWAGLYCSRIHTDKDTILEKENVNILRECIVDLIRTGAVE